MFTQEERGTEMQTWERTKSPNSLQGISMYYWKWRINELYRLFSLLPFFSRHEWCKAILKLFVDPYTVPFRHLRHERIGSGSGSNTTLYITPTSVVGLKFLNRHAVAMVTTGLLGNIYGWNCYQVTNCTGWDDLRTRLTVWSGNSLPWQRKYTLHHTQ